MILDKIVAWKEEEVKKLRQHGFRRPETIIAPPRGFQRRLTTASGEIAVIAEAKKASPSKGVICADFDPVDIARSYLAGGARAISVLTDKNFFQGDINYIPLVRQAVNLPVLRKDFIVDEIQIREAAAYGADAILLIAAILSAKQIQEYLAMAAGLNLDVLVEIHDESDLEKALAAGSLMIGINNRNLRDFSVDLNTTLRLKDEIPASIPVVSESGIRNHDDVKLLQDAGVSAVLVGETLMRAPNRQLALQELLGNV